MTESLRDFHSATLKDYVESLSEVTWTSVESDQHVFLLMSAIAAFRFRDDEWFDFNNPDLLPKNASMREVIELLTSPQNSEFVYGYYERECQEEMNPFAKRVWSYLRARIQRQINKGCSESEE